MWEQLQNFDLVITLKFEKIVAQKSREARGIMVDSHHAELEEETRVEASQAYNILAELEQENKITPEKAELYK